MNKRTKLSLILKCTGLLFLFISVVFFFLSFNVKREIQEVFGFSSIAFIPIGVFCLIIGQLFQKDRSKRIALGMVLLAIGVTLLLLGMVLSFGILITIFGFGLNSIWILVDCTLLVLAIAFISVASVLILGAKSKPL